MVKRFIVLIIATCTSVAIHAQRGEASISAGPLISIPFNDQNGYSGHSRLKTGAGFEALGQYNFSNRSVFLLQLGTSFYGIKDPGPDTASRRTTITTIKVGYKYQFGPSGFYANILYGVDSYSSKYLSVINQAGTSSSVRSTTLGAGKRFVIKEIYFIDAGVDFITNLSENRMNVKTLFSIFRWPKKR